MSSRAESTGASRAGRSRASGKRSRDEAEVEFARIVAFSDGVFAIAITLVVLNLQIPDGADDLAAALKDDIPIALAYALTFAVVGRMWFQHHRFYAELDRFDGGLMALNVVYLAFVALVPFSSDVLGEFGDHSAAVIVYAGNIAAIGLVAFAMNAHAHAQELIAPEVLSRRGPLRAAEELSLPGVFLVSMPLALINPIIAYVSWGGLLFVGIRRRRRERPRGH